MYYQDIKCVSKNVITLKNRNPNLVPLYRPLNYIKLERENLTILGEEKLGASRTWHRLFSLRYFNFRWSPRVEKTCRISAVNEKANFIIFLLCFSPFSFHKLILSHFKHSFLNIFFWCFFKQWEFHPDFSYLPVCRERYRNEGRAGKGKCKLDWAAQKGGEKQGCGVPEDLHESN